MNPWIVWPASLVIGGCAALAFWVLTTGTSLDVAGYVISAVGGVAIGKLTEARHPAHFGPEAKKEW